MNNPGMTGLASLQQHGVAVPSDTKNIEYYFKLAKKMSDGQLADVLSGKSLNVPQFVAMTEAMGRKQLRQAVDGAQAQQQAQQPSVKDQLLAENAAQSQGLAGLPAPNMEALGEGHAAGGIIAFNGENGSQVPTQEEIDAYIANNPALQRSHAITNPGEAISKWWSELPSQQEIWERGRKARSGEISTFSGNELTPKGKLVEQGLVDSNTAIRDLKKVAAEREAAKEPQMSKIDWSKVGDKKPDAGTPPATPPSGGKEPPSSALSFSPRKSRMEGLKTEEVDYNKIKERGLGEGYLAMADALMSKPGAAGLGAAFGALGRQAGLTNKEIAGLKKDEKDYNFLMAKAQDAFDQGNDKLAFDYKKQADEHKYHMAHVAALGANNPLALVAAVKKDPSILNTLADIAGAKSDPRTNQVLIGKHADYMKSYMGTLEPLTFDQWLQKNGYLNAGQQVAGSGNQGYSAVYNASEKRI